MLTGKTIGQLTFLETPTSDTLIPVELNGETYHMAYSAITFSGGGSSGGGLVETTYSELLNSVTGETLSAGTFYLITDFRTCYDQPDYDYNKNALFIDNYKEGPIEPIIVFATSANTLSTTAYQAAYPNDKIQYDVYFSQTEQTSGPAYGRITERIDEFNNRTDYDHRTILFKRYRYYEINFDNPYQGTVQVSSVSATEMTVLGTGTNFLSIGGVGTKVGFDTTSNDYKVYEITNVVSDTEMTITGLTNINLSSGTKMFPADWGEYGSYYQNNVDDSTTLFEEYYTFDFENNPSGNKNNYIGNHANLFQSNENDFILANNVFYITFRGNKFGNSCYNNTFFDDCDNNTVGNYFYNNITDNDFDGNVIGNYYYNNRITSNFQYNKIGENFYNNYIVQNSFYRNNIGNDFRDNQISGDDFQNNEIGNQFNNNVLRNGQFYKNDIGNGYNGNEIYTSFYGNLIGNGFNDNQIYCQFYENNISEVFANNNLGNPNSYGSFDFNDNRIGNNFYNNTCLGTFAYNSIGSDFYDNIIEDGFGYGYNSSQGNVIGNYFYQNTIGEYFYNNTIVDGFYNNQVYHYFQMNNVKSPYISGVDFTQYYGNIIDFTYTANGSTATDGLYTSLTASTNGDGINATFDVEVASNSVIGVSLDDDGKFYGLNDTLTILGSQIGGVDVDDDIVITVTDITQTPSVYESFNCEIFRNSNNTDRLSYYDGNDILTIKNINE
jgi:hypothetical protein